MESQDHVRTLRRGYVLDAASLDRELAARGVTAQQLAHAAGIGTETISRARRGLRIDTSTMNAIASALEKIPPRAMLARLVTPEVVAT